MYFAAERNVAGFKVHNAGKVCVLSVNVCCCHSLLTGGPGVHDPCERDPTDVLSDLSPQKADTITGSAQVSYIFCSLPLHFQQSIKQNGIELKRTLFGSTVVHEKQPFFHS